jgi:hypothetical protein
MMGFMKNVVAVTFFGKFIKVKADGEFWIF